MATDRTSWRRTWRPNISALPWIPLKTEGDSVLVKAEITQEMYTIFVFDGVHTWHERCTKNDIASKAKEFNRNVEAPVSTLLQHLDDCISQRSVKASLTMEKTNEILTLSVSSHLTGRVPFKWSIAARKTSNAELSEHMISPLLCMVSELLRREQAFVALLKRKDVEIEDLKAGGAKVSRKKLETTPFNHKAFVQEMVHSNEFENLVSEKGRKRCFSEDSGQMLYKEVMTTSAYIAHRDRMLEEAEKNDEMLVDEHGNHPSTAPTLPVASSPSWANKVPPSLLEGNASATSSPASHQGSRNASPQKAVLSPEKTEEMLRREALERKLAEEKEKEKKKENKKKRKKLF